MKKILLIILLLITILLFLLIKNNSIPSDIGLKNGRFSELKNSDNGVSTQTIQESKKVEALVFYGDINETKKVIFQALELCGDYEIKKETENYMHLVFVSDRMKFKDDLEIYIDEMENLIHYRSQSRLGYSDMGVNLERYNKISSYYKEKFIAINAQ